MLSPLLVDDCAIARLMTSAERRLAQQRHLFHLALGHADERFGRVEDLPQHVRGQALDRQQVMQFAVFVELRIARIKPHAGA
jgi:hypothetical protein